MIKPVIVHVTEALGAGVAHSISQLAKAQLDTASVFLIYSRRPDTPSEDKLDLLFPHPILRIEVDMVTPLSPYRDIVSIFTLHRFFKSIQPRIIHLHSSKAGALGRLAFCFLNRNISLFYSPRGFSFLRRDISRTYRLFFLYAERFLALLPGTLIACSATEAELAHNSVKHKRVTIVENCVELDKVISSSSKNKQRIKVATSGRICFQKAPWKFSEIASHYSDKLLEFVWIGGGDLLELSPLPRGSLASLKVTGWLDRSAVLHELSLSDIFVMTSLWEGMPLSLIEAQAAGLPAVVPDVIGCRDIVLHEKTGFVCKSHDEMVFYLDKLIYNAELRRFLGANAREIAFQRFSLARMHEQMIKVYAI
jgi:glycosyltransferase involved in cell wall biosynthesis